MFEIIAVSILLVVVSFHFFLNAKTNLPFIIVAIFCLTIIYLFLSDDIAFFCLLPFVFIFIFYFISYKSKPIFGIKEYVMMLVASSVAFFLVHEIWFDFIQQDSGSSTVEISLFLFLPLVFIIGASLINEVSKND